MKKYSLKNGALGLLLSFGLAAGSLSNLQASAVFDARDWDPNDPCVEITVGSSWASGSGYDCLTGGSYAEYASGSESFTGLLCPGDYAEFIDESYSWSFTDGDCNSWGWFTQTYG